MVRGILIGVVDSLEQGKHLLNELNFEKLVLWYHDMYKRHTRERREKNTCYLFLSEVVEWYRKKQHELPGEKIKAVLWRNIDYLKGATGPLESIERFVKDRQAAENEKDDEE